MNDAPLDTFRIQGQRESSSNLKIIYPLESTSLFNPPAPLPAAFVQWHPCPSLWRTPLRSQGTGDEGVIASIL